MSATTSEATSEGSAISWLVATFFGIGRLGPGPGTWASGATVLIWWLVATRISVDPRWPALGIAVVVVAIGIPASTRVARESGIEDPGFVVIDEVAGQMIPLIVSPLQWKYLLLSLILFRCFDIFKPPPLRALERLPEGTGIMLDDVGAGIYALLVLLVALRFWPAS